MEKIIRLEKINRRSGGRNYTIYKTIDQLEYIIFGPFTPKQESEKFDIAQGGIDTKDMPPLESEEEAARRIKTRR